VFGLGLRLYQKSFLDYLKEIKIEKDFKTFKLAKPYNKEKKEI
jgi:hypothetical protein